MGEQAIEAAVNVVNEMLEANSGNSFLTDEQVLALTVIVMEKSAQK